jgi:hypothetical protein
MDLIEREQRAIELDELKTELKKEQFIKKIRNGLGDEIRQNGNKIKRIEKSRWERFLDRLKNLF